MKRLVITVGFFLVIGLLLSGCVSGTQSEKGLVGVWKGSFESESESGPEEMWQQFEFSKTEVVNKLSENKSMKPLKTGTRKGTYSVDGDVITIQYEEVWISEDEEWMDFPEDNDPVRSGHYSLNGDTLFIAGNEFKRQ